jgi:glycosyltransferase involved in cell wall biosynthesis
MQQQRAVGQLDGAEQMAGNNVTVCTATIPPRTEMLQRAIESVNNQTLKPRKHIIEVDQNKIGHAAMLDQMIARVKTKYVMFLDDDDEFLPDHVELLYNKIIETDADLVYPHFRYSMNNDAGHLERFFNVEWDNKKPHQVPITWICKTSLFKELGGFSLDFDPESYKIDESGNRIGHDFLFILRLVQNGKRIVHLPKVTWIYHNDRQSTLGMPSRW